MAQIPKVNWAQLTAPLRPETNAAIAAFRGRYVELSKQLEVLQAQNVDIDFNNYRKTIAETKLVEDAERSLKSFKPSTFDTSAQIAELNKGEKIALESARTNAAKVQDDFSSMKKLWEDIDKTVPVDELTVEHIEAAYPDFDKTLDRMVRRGQWRMPGYYEKFGDFHIGF